MNLNVKVFKVLEKRAWETIRADPDLRGENVIVLKHAMQVTIQTLKDMWEKDSTQV